MKVPKYIINNLNSQADYMIKIRSKDKQFQKWCETNKVDTTRIIFEDRLGYILGDCSADPMINYLKNEIEERNGFLEVTK